MALAVAADAAALDDATAAAVIVAAVARACRGGGGEEEEKEAAELPQPVLGSEQRLQELQQMCGLLEPLRAYGVEQRHVDGRQERRRLLFRRSLPLGPEKRHLHGLERRGNERACHLLALMRVGNGAEDAREQGPEHAPGRLRRAERTGSVHAFGRMMLVKVFLVVLLAAVEADEEVERCLHSQKEALAPQGRVLLLLPVRLLLLGVLEKVDRALEAHDVAVCVVHDGGMALRVVELRDEEVLQDHARRQRGRGRHRGWKKWGVFL